MLLTAPILMNFLFFTIYAFGSFGLSNFSVVALGQLYGTSPVTANTALSGYLLLSALGVLVGGVITGPTGEPEFRPEMGIGEPADSDVLPSAAGLVWRALLVWLAVLVVLTLAYWAP